MPALAPAPSTGSPSASGFGVNVTLAGVPLACAALGTTVVNPPTKPVVVTGSLAGEMPAGHAFYDFRRVAFGGDELQASSAYRKLSSGLFGALSGIADPARCRQIAGAGMNSLSDVVVARLKAER